MVKANLSILAFPSTLYGVLSILSGPFQTCNRAIGSKVFLRFSKPAPTDYSNLASPLWWELNTSPLI
jgi:hypothetical protein